MNTQRGLVKGEDESDVTTEPEEDKN